MLLGLLGKERQDGAPELTPLRATEAHTFEPFDAAGHVNPALHVVASLSGDCWSDSSTSNRVDAWRCRSQNVILDPCFQGPGPQGQVLVCEPDVWSGNVVLLNLAEPMPEHFGDTVSPENGSIWDLVLATGERCSFVTGATDSVDGLRANYYCTSSDPDNSTGVYGEVDQTDPQWKVRVWRNVPTSPPSVEALEVVTVDVAWR